MAYTLQALLSASVDCSPDGGLQVVRLHCGLQMLPLSTEFRRNQSIPFLPLLDDDREELPATILSLCKRLGKQHQFAYVEAEFFGGTGIQAHALFLGGNLIRQPMVSDCAINEALRWLGVNRVDSEDEFTTVGLYLHRDTDA